MESGSYCRMVFKKDFSRSSPLGVTVAREISKRDT